VSSEKSLCLVAGATRTPATRQPRMLTKNVTAGPQQQHTRHGGIISQDSPRPSADAKTPAANFKHLPFVRSYGIMRFARAFSILICAA